MIPNFVKVDLACNNRNGVFTGVLEGIAFGKWDEENLIDAPFDIDEGYLGINIHFIDNNLFLGRFKIKLLRHYTSQASWCFDTIVISKEDLVRLLNYLRNKDFCFWEGNTDLMNKFENKELKEIKLEDVIIVRKLEDD